MKLLLNREQAALADLHAFGAGLLLRYEKLLQADIDPTLGAVLARIAQARRPLIKELAACEKSRGRPPRVGDREINELRAIADRLIGSLFGSQASGQRVIAAENAWLERLGNAQDLDWHEHEEALLQQLKTDAATARDRLAQFADHSQRQRS